MRREALIRAARTGVASVWILWSAPLTAQLVQIEPGYVKAPFVEVYSYPDGSSYVRAPFVSIHSPPRHRPLPYAAPPVVSRPSPTIVTDVRAAEDLDGLDWKSLRRRIREGAARLDRAVAGLGANSAQWQTYLRTGQLGELLAADSDQPPTAAEREQLTEIAGKYDATTEAANFGRITGLDGFRTVRSGLRELLKSPLERQRQLVVKASDQLQQELTQLAAGATWQDYFRLPADLRESHAGAFPAPPGTPADTTAGLETLQDRFRQVAEDPRYRQIAELPAFRSTYQRLSDYGELLLSAGVSEVEQLPPPLPDAAPNE